DPNSRFDADRISRTRAAPKGYRSNRFYSCNTKGSGTAGGKKLRVSRRGRGEPDVSRDNRCGRVYAEMGGGLRYRYGTGRLRAAVPEPFGRRTNGGGVVRAARLVKAAFGHPHRVFRRADDEHG